MWCLSIIIPFKPKSQTLDKVSVDLDDGMLESFSKDIKSNKLVHVANEILCWPRVVLNRGDKRRCDSATIEAFIRTPHHHLTALRVDVE